MTKKILKALKGSIKKWEKIVKGTGVDEGCVNCPLCQVILGCYECPVYISKEEDSCGGTPYVDWYYHHKINHVSKRQVKIYCPECKRLAKEELKFLKGLLPK